jgi:cell division protein FtsX
MLILKLALRPWAKAFVTQSLCVLAVGVLIFLGATFGTLSQSLDPVLARAEGQDLLTVVLDSTQTPEQEKKTIDEVHLTLGSAPTAVFVSPETFLERLREVDPDLVQEVIQLGESARSVVPRFLTVTGAGIGEKMLDLKTVPGVESVESSKSQFTHIAQTLRNIRWGGRVLGGGVLIALFCLLVVLARLNEQFFVESLKIIKFWGAPYWALILPSLLSMLSVGVFGGGLAYFAWRGLGPDAVHQFQSFSPLLNELEIPWIAVGNEILVFSFLFSVVCGWLGARTRQ